MLGGAVFDLAAKATDVHIHGAGASKIIIAPYLAQQGLPGVHPSRVGHQEAEELVLLNVRTTRRPPQDTSYLSRSMITSPARNTLSPPSRAPSLASCLILEDISPGNGGEIKNRWLPGDVVGLHLVRYKATEEGKAQMPTLPHRRGNILKVAGAPIQEHGIHLPICMTRGQLLDIPDHRAGESLLLQYSEQGDCRVSTSR